MTVHNLCRLASVAAFLACLWSGTAPLAAEALSGAPAPMSSAASSPHRSVALAPSEEAERLWAQRRAQAQPIDFFMPYYSVESGTNTALFLMNPIADPIAVTATALDGEGGELPLGTFVIESRHHLELPLRQLIRGFEDEFGTGSVRLSLLGDADTLQGWTVITTEEGQVFEVPIANPATATATTFHSFWDVTGHVLPGARRIRFEIINTSDEMRRVEVTSLRSGKRGTEALILPPYQRRQLTGIGPRPFESRGAIVLQHDGAPGDVVAVGLITGRSSVAALELVGVGEATERHHYESIPFSTADRPTNGGIASGPPTIILFRPGSADDPVEPLTLQVLAADSGGILGTATVPLLAGQVQSISLERLLRGAEAIASPIRVRLVSESVPFLAQAFTLTAESTAADLMLFPREAAHGNGTYPLPDPARYGTITHLVNIGEQDSTIVVQVNWRGGTWSLGPLEVPAGGSRRIDLRELATDAPPDLLGRRLDPELPEGVLKWSVIKGGVELIARTEVTPRGRADHFGFNCWGCCWQQPHGLIVPAEVSFPLGEQRFFESSVVMEDCGGTMGPYPTGADVFNYSSPFTWDGTTVSATAAADGDLGFEGDVLRMTTTCASILKRIFGFGRAKVCEKTFNPRGYSPSKTCSFQTSFCLECKACCNNIAQMQTCQGKEAGTVESNRRTCIGLCINDFNNCG